jgi:ribosomal protein L37E
MAHQIYEVTVTKLCPRCGSNRVRITFGTTYLAECAGCGFGKSYGDNEKMAQFRLYEKYLPLVKKVTP